jgi:2-oxoglutarate dehydrogenase E1 component
MNNYELTINNQKVFEFYKKNSSLNFELISRLESSSTATGYAKQHIAQQLYIVASAFESKPGLKDKKQVKAATKKIVNID